MRISSLLALTLTTASIMGINLPPTPAIQRRDGSVSFESAPRLLDAVTTYNNTGVWAAKYYFTIDLPADAGEPLGKVTIAQREGFEDIKFELEDTFAFVGTHRNKGKRLNVSQVNKNEETGAITVNFEPAIPPGTTFTVGLKPKRNPLYGGVYLFGVTVFPAAEIPYPLYIGVGRMHFYGDWYDSFY
ncbi:MAG: DUF2808 domain-containing protein [Oscillatoria sp. PMC 1051.18]|nr:DUF2808 domain-containing protein [Oscillatoria sp. PMC 1050.18]MEC5028782.1 DUF2808 domain-containing protein [Oscillatoria sp. PMC 1051.18]